MEQAESERRLGWIAIAVVAALVVIGVVAVRSWGDGDGPLNGANGAADFSTGLTRIPPGERGEPLDLSGNTLEDERLDIADWRGRVVVVNIWGSWCGPCRKEAPDLARAYASTRDRGVEFLGIDVRDNVAAAKAFQEEYGIQYPSLFDADGSLLLSFTGIIPVSAVPSTIVLDQDGRVAASVVGITDFTTLRGLVVDVLRERQPAQVSGASG